MSEGDSEGVGIGIGVGVAGDRNGTTVIPGMVSSGGFAGNGVAAGSTGDTIGNTDGIADSTGEAIGNNDGAADSNGEAIGGRGSNGFNGTTAEITGGAGSNDPAVLRATTLPRIGILLGVEIAV